MRWSLLVALLASACVPNLPADGLASCARDGDVCPPQQSCRSDGRCYRDDAGPTDAGPTDAGPTDAGPTDAGPMDAGPMDGGPMDGGPDGGPCSDDLCDTELAASNARGACFEGECAATACLPGFGDCNDEPGCETSLVEPSNCGGCGVTCSALRPCVADGARALCDEARIDEVLAFGDSTCVLYADGDLACWGDNQLGQLLEPTASAMVDGGAPTDGGVDAGPVGVAATQIDVPRVVHAFGQRGVRLAGGGRPDGLVRATACARRPDGTLACWGSNHRGELGFPADGDPHPAPVAVTEITGADDIAVGHDFACAIQGGEVRCWGDATSSQRAGADAFARVPLVDTATHVAARDQHACAVVEREVSGSECTGCVQCWGNNDSGQAAKDPASHATATVPLGYVDDTSDVPIEDVDELALANVFSCARAGTEVSCWGAAGGLGTGESADRFQAAPITLSAGVTQIAAGAEHACALLDEAAGREVVCWGNMDGTSGWASALPQRVMEGSEPLRNVLAITSGQHHACALDVHHRVLCWGDNASRQLGSAHPSGATLSAAPAVGFERAALVAGQAALALHTDLSSACLRGAAGGVACWGSHSSGRLGNRQTDGVSADPSPIVMPSREAPLPQFTEVALGGSMACGIALDGQLHCWGNNSDQAVPGTDDNPVTSPFRPEGGALTDVLGVAIVAGTGCALVADEVRCWGNNNRCAAGQTPCGSRIEEPTPVTLPSEHGVPVEVGVGFRFACARTHRGRVLCWGRNDSGQRGVRLGMSSTDPAEPVVQSGGGVLEGAVGLTVGYDHACVRLADGTARCWGSNASNQLGVEGASSAVPVTPEVGTALVSLTAGQERTCGRLTDGDLRCWGRVGEGEPVDAQDPRLAPTPVEPVAPAEDWGEAALELEPRTVNYCAVEPSTDSGPERVLCWGADSDVLARIGGAPLANPTPMSFFPAP